MYMICELENDALGDCVKGCTNTTIIGDTNCNDDPIHAWDEAVALYMGSSNGSSRGV
jgi:hypothetical protein